MNKKSTTKPAFYSKLALTNLQKNRATYFPYILTCILSVAMFYIMHSISINEGLKKMSGADQLSIILSLGTVVIGIFTAIFLFYTNSFLMKRRKKELGLFNILGMEKKHIANIMLFETLYVALAGLVIGLLGGVLLSKLMFLILLKIINFGVPLIFSVSFSSILITLAVFAGIFLATLLSNLMQIHLSKPIELLKGGQVGEKEPKTKWILTLIGCISLGAGYTIALTVESPLQAINLFFIAVILVMIGTYSLFTAGSIALLKLLKKNKSYYYKTNHFISVSSMIYRMKQNAVGLANICILSTAVLVMLSTTVSLYVGMDDVLKNRYPQDISIQYDNATAKNSEIISKIIIDEQNAHNVSVENQIDYRSTWLICQREENKFIPIKKDSAYNTAYLSSTALMTVEDYNKLENKNLTLAPNEAIVYSVGKGFGESTIILKDREFKVKEELSDFKVERKSEIAVFEGYYVIVDNIDTIKAIYKSAEEKDLENPKYILGFDLKGSEDNISKYIVGIRNKINSQIQGDIKIDTLQENKTSFFGVNGGLLFLGIFLGMLFLMATVLIIYYKQVSEGYDDKERFEIMQNVGMSKQEVKKSIQSQIIMVFFLPLLAAVVHIAVAFKIITRLLAVLNLVNVPLFFGCTVATILVFAVIYVIVYSLTARAYYKIVR